MHALVLRSYEPADRKHIKDLYELASIHSEIGYRSGPWESDFENIEETYFDGGDFIVGIVDGKIVGFAGLLKKSEDVGHVRRMRVHPDHRRMGYAGQILTKLEEIAKKNGMKELQLKTSIPQKMAQAFYEKHGYKKMDAEVSYYKEGPFEIVWYRKVLVTI